MSNVVTRIPPSPTGRLHIGTARTALFNFLFARHHGGSVAFRSEDTDRERSSRDFENEILEGLAWLGLSWDSFTRQSERRTRHRELLEKTIASGAAYLSREPLRNDPSQDVEVVRLKNPGREVVFSDLIRGDINTHTGDLGDFVIARAIDDPLYHFAVVVDDMDAGVTHVIRGEDHISNTARQILIQEAVGAPRPSYAHLPLILDAKRAKLSKRSGATSLMDYREEGFLPEGMVNYLALLGWNPGGDCEDFSLGELIAAFTLAGVQKSGAVFDRTKLLSVNQRWMRKLSDTEFADALASNAPRAGLLKAVPLLKERAHTFAEARGMLSDELSALFVSPALAKDVLLAEEPPDAAGTTRARLSRMRDMISGAPETASADVARALLMPYADTEGRGPTLWPLRYALSGREKSPDPFTLIIILGKDETISRIEKAIAILGG